MVRSMCWTMVLYMNMVMGSMGRAMMFNVMGCMGGSMMAFKLSR